MATDAARRASAERGFTLIELLVAVVLVSVLAAVVLPMVNRFADHGTEEARLTEFHDVATAVILMMTHNEILSIPNPVTGGTLPCAVGTKVLSGFPDADSDNGQGAGNDGGKELDVEGKPYVFTGPPSGRDKQGYVLYDHDAVGGDGQAALLSYVSLPQAAFCYTTDRDGTVRQYLEDGTEQTS
ncbi:MAG: prepilin-type N-terminal cleavage/methylation domain-containing protein [Chloroflexi bacterium]|nr:prepilin-type N-terminal cleavage/methylation domain-containing protein [Chloroflexota bacterium]